MIHTSVNTLSLAAWEAAKSGDLSGLSRLPMPKAISAWAWRMCCESFVNEFGVTEEYKEYVKARVSELREWQRVFGGELHRIPIARNKAKAVDAMTSADPQPMRQILAAVSKEMGFRIDPRTTTVVEFFGYVDYLTEKARANG